MTKSNRPTGFMIAALVLALAALLPAVSGRAVKIVLLVVALIFFLVALRARRTPSAPRDA